MKLNPLLLACFTIFFITTSVYSQADESIVLISDDFEKGTAAPEGWRKEAKVPGVVYKYDKKNGKSGKRSLSLQKSADRYIPIAQWSRKIKLKGDHKSVKVSAQVKAEGATKSIIDVIFLDKNNDWISHEWIAYIGAKNGGDPPADHDWKEYNGQTGIPDGTVRIQLALQIYGPGKVWFDDLKMVADDSAAESRNENEDSADTELENLVEVQIAKSVGTYLFVPARSEKAPKNGNGLLVVLPGGDGSADFHPFVSNIHANSLGKDFALAQPIAKQWTNDQVIVWPTEGSKVKKMKYSTEQLIESVVKDVSDKSLIDPKRVYVLAWSSGGPAAYASLLKKNGPLSGGILAMSVFKPNQLPTLSNGKERSFYILHSPGDRVCPYRMAKNAETLLTDAGARTKFTDYKGGHGWHGNVFGNISAGIKWLESK